MNYRVVLSVFLAFATPTAVGFIGYGKLSQKADEALRKADKAASVDSINEIQRKADQAAQKEVVDVQYKNLREDLKELKDDMKEIRKDLKDHVVLTQKGCGK